MKNKSRLRNFVILFCLVMIEGCATYKYSKQTKLVALSDDITRGPSIGPIEGRDCRWIILGVQVRSGPTLDLAIKDALSRTQLESLAPSGNLAITPSTNIPGPVVKIRYINNISTINEGYNLGIFEKKCLVLSGIGHL